MQSSPRRCPGGTAGRPSAALDPAGWRETCRPAQIRLFRGIWLAVAGRPETRLAGWTAKNQGLCESVVGA